VNHLVRAAGFSDDTAYLMEWGIVEAATNVVKHAYDNESGRSLELVMELNQSGVMFKMIDCGRPMIWPRPVILDFDPDDILNLPESGYGLYIMHHVMDSVDYTTCHGKNMLTLTKSLPESVKNGKQTS
jgi:serine/threonine-protein kinase RsbW